MPGQVAQQVAVPVTTMQGSLLRGVNLGSASAYRFSACISCLPATSQHTQPSALIRLTLGLLAQQLFCKQAVALPETWFVACLQKHAKLAPPLGRHDQMACCSSER